VPSVFAVELSEDPGLLLVAGVFVLTFVLVCGVAYGLLLKGRRRGGGSTWHVQFGSELPVSKETFDAASHAVERAVTPPWASASTVATLDGLERVRRGFAWVYRTGFILGGIAGIGAGIMLLLSHTPANMQGLPGAILFLLGLGAMINGLIPPRSVANVEPLAPELLRQMREKISVEVKTLEPLEVKLGKSEIQRLSAMIIDGTPIGEALGDVYPAYEELSELVNRWLESTLSKHLPEMTKDTG
jgi:hypothetical protein